MPKSKTTSRVKKRKYLHLLSVIVPAYKKEKIILSNIKSLQSVLKNIRYNFEIIVVVDGSPDKTYQKAKKLTSRKIRVFNYEKNRGKGYALRYGIKHAKGHLIAFVDAGGEIDPNGLSMLLEHFEWYDADIVVGSKLHPVSIVNYPFSRKILSFGYQWLTKMLFGLKIRDTQAGMKIYRREVLLRLLPKLTIDRYAFDIEILALAHTYGYKRIFEAPIKLDYEFESLAHASDVYSILQIFIDTMKVFYLTKISLTHKKHGKKYVSRQIYNTQKLRGARI